MSLAPGTRFPDIELPDHAGNPRRLSDAPRGDRALLDDDPFARIFPALRLEVGAGVLGRCGPPPVRRSNATAAPSHGPSTGWRSRRSAGPMVDLPAPRLTCKEVVELLSDYVDGALPARERARVAAHLETCPDCTAYLAQLRATIGAVGRLREDDVAVPIRDRLLAALRG